MSQFDDFPFLPRVGMDLCDPQRIRKAMDRHGKRFVERIFTKGEIDYCSSLGNPASSFAARFAAKEAVMKVLGAGLGKVGFKEIEVKRGVDGRPTLIMSGRAREMAESIGIYAVDISLTHEKSLAGAVAFALSRKTA